MLKRLIVNILFFSVIIICLYAAVNGIMIAGQTAVSPITTNLK